MDKFFLKSKTILGIIISIMPALLPEVGVSFSEADGQLITSTWDSIIQSVGAVLAVYGRFDAGNISLTGGK